MNGQEVISSFLWATWLVENRYPDLKPLAVRESRSVKIRMYRLFGRKSDAL